MKRNVVKQVIVIRNDLNMRKGKMVAQGAHAAMMFMLEQGERDSSEAERWFEDGITKIVVRAESLQQLNELHVAAKTAGLFSHMIIDAGHTEFHGVPTATALAIGPGRIEVIDKITSHLTLL